jgi:hypothetical protein
MCTTTRVAGPLLPQRLSPKGQEGRCAVRLHHLSNYGG